MWNIYKEESLKSAKGAKLGSSTQEKLQSAGKFSPNWKSFLLNDNKKELFQKLAECSVKNNSIDKVILNTFSDTILCSQNNVNCDLIKSCNHEEADARMLLHVKHLTQSGYKCLIKTGDTDVLVIRVMIFRYNIFGLHLVLEIASDKLLFMTLLSI